MKIEFKKIPSTLKEFQTEFASVELEGTFCKISPSLVKIEANLQGTTQIECCRCGKSEDLKLDEELDFLLSDGIFNKESEELVIEIENGTIDFDEIIQNELASIQSEYHYCSECQNTDEVFEKEF
ncbi:MAG: hypothetical protein ACNI3C_06170 [Candidatus Marinarcus sp.]|uniref:hypothetical protein n=1 Tax=Candidatus Marinarcus sp. TaxID=3100987 RepID=UPI003B002721